MEMQQRSNTVKLLLKNYKDIKVYRKSDKVIKGNSFITFLFYGIIDRQRKWGIIWN